VGHRTILFVGGTVFMEIDNPFLTPQLRQERCMRFVKSTGVSYGLYSKSSEFFCQCRVRVTVQIYEQQKSFGSHVKQCMNQSKLKAAAVFILNPETNKHICKGCWFRPQGEVIGLIDLYPGLCVCLMLIIFEAFLI
jgi:hypothetical protein